MLWKKKRLAVTKVQTLLLSKSHKIYASIHYLFSDLMLLLMLDSMSSPFLCLILGFMFEADKTNLRTFFLWTYDFILPQFTVFSNFFFFFFNFNFYYFISWRLITLQYCSGFCHTLKWISHGFTCVPHPDPLSYLIYGLFRSVVFSFHKCADFFK